jgi:hypothetical protein
MSFKASLDASSLFRVDGMIAVVTGGGTGEPPLLVTHIWHLLNH